MSPLRRRNVGAPLVTPGAGTAQGNPFANGITPQMEFRPPRRTASANGKPRPLSGRHECRPYVWQAVGASRRGATCDARCRHGTTEFRRKRNPSANGITPQTANHGIHPQTANTGIRLQMGTPAFVRERRTAAFACPGKSHSSSGRHECRPYVGETNPSRKT